MKSLPIMFTILLFSLSTMFEKSSIEFKMSLFKESDLNLSFMKSETSMMFFVMISMVTMIIVFYSTFYMEFYNKKKFSVLTMAFFFSMAILSMSSDFTTTMIGWDGLGISSICLIMMYQSKSTITNSLTTMAFNRLGDILIMTGMILAAMNLSNFSFTVCKEMGMSSLIMLIMASMTKSAQFPLSTWLPAAMSAPTPISAMVHSSTLVTAGVYLATKIYQPLMKNNLMSHISVISSISMMTAGLCTIYIMDLKKIIAFSTMSHISMMMFMISKGMLKMSAIHMLAHAMFKTAIFMSAGSMFIHSLSDQNIKFMSKMKKSNSQEMMMKTSTLSLTGIPFTSSFYSKELFLENMMSMMNKTSDMIIMWSSTVLTMSYSLKLIKSISEKINVSKTFNMKKNSLSSSMVMSAYSTTGSSMALMLTPCKSTPMVEKMEMSMIPTFMILTLMIKWPKSKMMMMLSNSMMMKKVMTTKEINSMMKMSKSMNMSDILMTYSKTWKMLTEMKMNKMNNFYFKSSVTLTLISMFIYSVY